MRLKIKCLDKSLPLPEYKTEGAVAFNIFSRVDEVIKPREIKYLPLNLTIQVLTISKKSRGGFGGTD